MVALSYKLVSQRDARMNVAAASGVFTVRYHRQRCVDCESSLDVEDRLVSFSRRGELMARDPKSDICVDTRARSWNACLEPQALTTRARFAPWEADVGRRQARQYCVRSRTA